MLFCSVDMFVTSGYISRDIFHMASGTWLFIKTKEWRWHNWQYFQPDETEWKEKIPFSLNFGRKIPYLFGIEKFEFNFLLIKNDKIQNSVVADILPFLCFLVGCQFDFNEFYLKTFLLYFHIELCIPKKK